jgi:5-(aminomethyl)-3-furanmethanol phosphate kinase
MMSSPIWVVKLGGSLFNGHNLRGWLKALVAQGGGSRIVVVPGGGPFTDQVRAAQQRWGFDDAIGHRMAMLGMGQYGLMLTGLQPGLAPAADETGILGALERGRVAMWIPTGSEPLDLPRNWSVTSDSLAAWLSNRLQARHLLLVKSLKFPAGKLDAGELARHGVIDETLPKLLVRACHSCRIVAAEDYALLTAMLTDIASIGTELIA